MDLHDLVGDWQLVSSASVASEIPFTDGEPDPNGVDDWLNGHALDLASEASPATGLFLQIEPDGRFSEQKRETPQIDWFDAEGVLDSSVVPFDGLALSNGAHVFLRPTEIARWAVPTDGKHGAAILRLDDGDTKIADRIDAAGDTLVRSVSVVTDEMYLNRIALVYARP